MACLGIPTHPASVSVGNEQGREDEEAKKSTKKKRSHDKNEKSHKSKKKRLARNSAISTSIDIQKFQSAKILTAFKRRLSTVQESIAELHHSISVKQLEFCTLSLILTSRLAAPMAVPFIAPPIPIPSALCGMRPLSELLNRQRSLEGIAAYVPAKQAPLVKNVSPLLSLSSSSSSSSCASMRVIGLVHRVIGVSSGDERMGARLHVLVILRVKNTSDSALYDVSVSGSLFGPDAGWVQSRSGVVPMISKHCSAFVSVILTMRGYRSCNTAINTAETSSLLWRQEQCVRLGISLHWYTCNIKDGAERRAPTGILLSNVISISEAEINLFVAAELGSLPFMEECADQFREGVLSGLLVDDDPAGVAGDGFQGLIDFYSCLCVLPIEVVHRTGAAAFSALLHQMVFIERELFLLGIPTISVGSHTSSNAESSSSILRELTTSDIHFRSHPYLLKDLSKGSWSVVSADLLSGIAVRRIIAAKLPTDLVLIEVPSCASRRYKHISQMKFEMERSVLECLHDELKILSVAFKEMALLRRDMMIRPTSSRSSTGNEQSSHMIVGPRLQCQKKILIALMKSRQSLDLCMLNVRLR